MKFSDLLKQPNIYLYAGHMPDDRRKCVPFVGLMLQNRELPNHIHHDITKPMTELPDGCVDIYQAEDVLEHIELAQLPDTINEIYRVLKPGGLFRLSVPDYRCDVLLKRTHKNSMTGKPFFDPQGGGRYDAIQKKVVGGGHVWLPVYETTMELLNQTWFEHDKIKVLHAYLPGANFVCEPIDYSKGYISRTPDHDKRVQSPRRPMSIVIDLLK